MAEIHISVNFNTRILYSYSNQRTTGSRLQFSLHHIMNAGRRKYWDVWRVVHDFAHPLRLARLVVLNVYVVVMKKVLDHNDLVD